MNTPFGYATQGYAYAEAKEYLLSVDKDSNAIGNHLNWMGNYYLDR